MVNIISKLIKMTVTSLLAFLFAAVGNKYVVDSNMPESIQFTLVDKIHDITFVYILITILCSIISLKLYESKTPLNQKRFDKVIGAFVFF